MANRADWAEIKARRMREPGAQEAYGVARLAYELGKTARRMREEHGWSQAELGVAAGMTQSAVARFEAGGTVPSLPVLERLARALNADLIVQITSRTEVA
jgi:ribosome-binding protein aMBF1 (putative translation factor)